MANPYGLVDLTAPPTVEGPHTPAALNVLVALWNRQQGGAIPATGLMSPPPGTFAARVSDGDAAGPVAGVSDGPASDAPAAPKRKRGPYKKSENGRKHRATKEDKIKRRKDHKK